MINFLGNKKERIQINNDDLLSTLFSDDNIDIKTIFNKEKIDDNDKTYFHNFLQTIPKKINNNDDNKKLNLVLDLDNTLMYSIEFPKIPNKKDIHDYTFKILFKDINIETIRIKNEIYVFKFREGLKSFFQETNKFCNYYIYTASIMDYAKQIIEKIKNKFKISIKGIMANKDLKNRDLYKNLEKINLKSENSIILDDNCYAWKNNLSNLLLSKRFFDYQMMNFLFINYSKEIGDYNFIIQNKNNHNELNVSFGKYQFIMNKKVFFPFNVESNNFSQKNQLKYLSNLIKKIHYLYYNYQINVPMAIKILRMNIFYNKTFYVSKNLLNYKELIGMIQYCGGNVVKSISQNNIIIIDKELKEKNNENITSEEYIYDCYYMLHQFNEKEKCYHFDKVIELK